MPEFPVSANDSAWPPLTRRGLLTGTAAAAASSRTRAAPDPPQAHASVATLAHHFTEALATYAAAERHRNDCERRYLEDGPMPPAALTRAGPLGRGLRDCDWWRADELAEMLADPRRRARHAVARALLPVARAYEAADQAFASACGLPAAIAAHDAAAETLNALADSILVLPPDSPAALALTARAVKAWGKPEWWSAQHADAYEQMAAQVLDGAGR